LILKAVAAEAVQAGSLGALQVQPGFYVYAGSAFGPGGLLARLSHHCLPAAKPHWHIDYLRQKTGIQEIWYTYASDKREHAWAQTIQALPGAQLPMPGFGSSDCRCISHLSYFVTLPSFADFQSCQPDALQASPVMGALHKRRLPPAAR
jgi:Uri superfamily endonuclease